MKQSKNTEIQGLHAPSAVWDRTFGMTIAVQSLKCNQYLGATVIVGQKSTRKSPIP